MFVTRYVSNKTQRRIYLSDWEITLCHHHPNNRAVFTHQLQLWINFWEIKLVKYIIKSLSVSCVGAKEVCSQVSTLVKECGEAENAAGAARTALDDLSKQLDLVRYNCKPHDKFLCDSVAFSPLHVKLSTSSVSFKNLSATNKYRI